MGANIRGATRNRAARYANYGKDYSSNFYNDRLTPVGNYEAGASPYGIQDMAGNVWEWTGSDYESGGKVIRGGSWYDPAYDMRSTNRFRTTPPYRDLSLGGFRCAQDAR